MRSGIIKTVFLIVIYINSILAGDDGSSSYVLNTGEKAIEHLKNQQKYLAEDSYEQLYKANLKAGQIVWDIGCGTGIMTEYISSVVGYEGHVYAMDVSEMQLNIIKKRLEKNNIKNVTLVLGDISDFKQNIYPKADLVYARLLLMHLQKPLAALSNMNKLLKHKGKIALQEAIIDTAHTFPQNKSVDRYAELILALAESKGIDYNIGKKLAKLSEQAGFHNTDLYILRHKGPITEESKNNFIKRINDMRSQIISANITDEDEMNRIVKDIELISTKDKNAYFAGGDQSYLIGTKN